MRVGSCAVREDFLLVRLISGANRDSSSQNAVSFSWARMFLRGPLRDQTHRELVYRPLQFQKCSQLLIGTHDEASSASDTAPTPSGFAEIVSDDLPILHAIGILRF